MEEIKTLGMLKIVLDRTVIVEKVRRLIKLDNSIIITVKTIDGLRITLPSECKNISEGSVIILSYSQNITRDRRKDKIIKAEQIFGEIEVLV